jgi:hypothetical protein
MLASPAYNAGCSSRADRRRPQLVDAEAELEQLFAGKHAAADAIDEATKTMALLQGRLRAEHLKTHLLELDLSRRSRQGSMLVCAAMSQTRPHLGEPGP